MRLLVYVRTLRLAAPILALTLAQAAAAEAGTPTRAEIRSYIERAITPPAIQVPPEVPRGWDVTIAPAGEPGERFVMSGRMLDSLGKPLAGVRVYVYHADARGWYADSGSKAEWPRLHGVLETDRGGRYRVCSVFPGSYGFTPHVHFVVWGKGRAPTALVVNVLHPRARRDSTLRHLTAESAGRAFHATRDSSGVLVLDHDVVVGGPLPSGSHRGARR